MKYIIIIKKRMINIREIYYQLINQPDILRKILIWYIMDYMLRKLCKKISDKPIKFTSYVLSIINTNYFYIFSNRIDLIAYYLYDIMIVLDTNNLYFIIHHIISIYLLILPKSHVDYEIIAVGLKYIKLSDIFLWYNKLIQLSHLGKYNYNLSIILRIISIVLSIVLWSYYRIFTSFIILINISDHIVLSLSSILFIANIVFIHRMFKLLFKLSFELYNYNVYVK